MNLHWSFRWGYGEDFLSNYCFKKRCVDSTPPPGANRVKKKLKKRMIEESKLKPNILHIKLREKKLMKEHSSDSFCIEIMIALYTDVYCDLIREWRF